MAALGSGLLPNAERRSVSGEVIDARTVRLDKVPGQSLWDHMNEGTLNKRMLEAADREYYRAHQFWRDESDGPWPHGNASMPSVIYDKNTRRARLIDFGDYAREIVAGQRRDMLTICWFSYSAWWTEFPPGSGFLLRLALSRPKPVAMWSKNSDGAWLFQMVSA